MEKPFNACTSPRFFFLQNGRKATEQNNSQKPVRDGSAAPSRSGCSESHAWPRCLRNRAPGSRRPAFPRPRGASGLEERRPSRPAPMKGMATASSKLQAYDPSYSLSSAHAVLNQGFQVMPWWDFSSRASPPMLTTTPRVCKNLLGK